MASDKRKRGLDQSARAAVSGLEWALEQLAEKPKQPDEFTAKECHAAQSERSLAGIRSLLDRMRDNGVLSCRKILVNGKHENVYRKA